MDQAIKKRLDIVDQIKDHVTSASPASDPFLYYLPEILLRPQFIHLNPENVLKFTKYTETHQKSAIMSDALHILNILVNGEDGRVHPPGPHMFYNNQHFTWKELGDTTNAVDVISHIINKTVFTLSLENIH